MSEKILNHGSTWNRWDLHIHSPETKLSDGFRPDNDEDVWDKYLEKLENSDVQVFGITDYFCCDNYFKVVEKYKKKYPNGKKVFFANIEFRITETVSTTNNHINIHVIFDNNVKTCPKDKLDLFRSKIKTQLTNESEAEISCLELKEEKDFKSSVVSLSSLKNALKEVFGVFTPYIIVTASNSDGLRELDNKSPRKIAIKDELDKYSHAFFGNSKNTGWFLQEDRYNNSQVKSDKKPVFSGSDAHSFNDLERLSGNVPYFEPTWIKAKLTFKGLQQTLFEPEGRVFIGEEPDIVKRQKQEANKFISRIEINQVEGYESKNGVWFKNINIPISHELTAIIGNKGSGKSAIADIIGLLGDSRQEKHFSFLTNKKGNQKFKKQGYAENFHATLYWGNNITSEKGLNDSVDLTNPEQVKYIPQNFFENLTNEIEISLFQDEIEKVVFSHVTESDRMGKDSFKDLQEFKTVQSKNDIQAYKIKLHDLNDKISQYEKETRPNNLESLKKKIKEKELEVLVLEESRPKLVTQPEQETEEEKKSREELKELSEIKSKLSKKREESTSLLTDNKISLQVCSSIQEKIISVDNIISTSKEELREKCNLQNLDIDVIISHEIDVSTLESRIDDLKKIITEFQEDKNVEVLDSSEFKGVKNIPHLDKYIKYITDKEKKIEDTLGAPQREYQSYIKSISTIDNRKEEITGKDIDPKPDTIKYYKQKLFEIEKDIPENITELKKEREELSLKIYNSKKKVLKFYKELKSNVEGKLSDISNDEFNVTIESAFLEGKYLSVDFFNFINQRAKGAFKGKEDGKLLLEAFLTKIEWDDFDSIYNIINEIIDSMNKEGVFVEDQVDKVTEFYDFLFSFDYFESNYELRLGNKNLDQLSPGEKGLLLLVFYLHLDKNNIPLVIDQPEDNLDNDSVFSVLAKCIREAKKRRQVILVTHNPNLAVGADAEEILFVKLEKHKDYKFSYKSGAIEEKEINGKIVQVLEGSKPAFVQRRLKYQI